MLGVGRIEEAVGYSDTGQTVIGRVRDEVPFGVEAGLGAVYRSSASPNGASSCAAPTSHAVATPMQHSRAVLVVALLAGCGEEAMATANGLIDAAEATHNPYRSRRRCLPTASLSATPIPPAHLTHCDGAW